MMVTTQFLRRTLARVLDHLEAEGLTELELEHDYYWALPPEALYNPLEDPKPDSLGQLSYDLEILQKVDAGTLPPLRNNLQQLGAILSSLGTADEP